MEWTSEIARGQWLTERVSSAGWPMLRNFVPDGFEAYVRVFHPMTRDIARGHDWATIDADFRRGTFYELDVENEPARWEDAARAFGTTMHPLAQSHRIFARDRYDPALLVDAEGWRYREPRQGSLDAESLAAVASVLARHTATPANGIAAIWEGFGGLVSSAGYAEMTFVANDGKPPRALSAWRKKKQQRAAQTALRRVPTPEPGSGLLSREAAAGPRLSLPNRDYILFSAGPHEFADDAWPHQAPWVRETEIGDPQSPTMLWPDDCAWFVISEIDLDSTIIGGTQELAGELLAHPRVEAHPIGLDSDLSWDGDPVA